MPIERPKFVRDEHLEFLDDLKTCGVTNMLGAGQYLEAAFGLNGQRAAEILLYWMKSFARRGSPKGNGLFSFSQPKTTLGIKKRA